MNWNSFDYKNFSDSNKQNIVQGVRYLVQMESGYIQFGKFKKVIVSCSISYWKFLPEDGGDEDEMKYIVAFIRAEDVPLFKGGEK